MAVWLNSQLRNKLLGNNTRPKESYAHVSSFVAIGFVVYW